LRVGVPREIKDGEARVGLTPEGAAALRAKGHVVLVERGAGGRVGLEDAAYAASGATVVADSTEVFAADLVVKVKEIQAAEYPRLRAGSIVFCYQQLARDPKLLQAVLDARIACLAYETVVAHDGSMPLLAPMSQISGRMAPLIGAWALQMAPAGPGGGGGILLNGLPGVAASHVLIIGAGSAGGEAAHTALGLGCRVTLLNRSWPRLEKLRSRFAESGNRLACGLATTEAIAAAIAGADVVIGAVLEPGKLSPKLITRAMLRTMRPGSVFVDVGLDQGGIAETTRMTSWSKPTYVEEGVVHFCVPNMPSAVARTATLALTGATLPFVERLADLGLAKALAADSGFAKCLYVLDGDVVHRGLAEDTGRPWRPFVPAA